MNATEGIRRVALVLGFLGCIGGALAELSFAAEIADIWKAGMPPSIPDLVLLTVWPAIGFVIPWAVVRTLTWALNTREGMRRVALVLGFVGCTIGLLAERVSAVQIWDRVAAHRRYVKLMALPFMRELVPRLSPHSVNVLPDGMPYGIKKVRVFEPREVSIELFTGQVESGYHGGPPSISDFALLTVWPVIGFIFPWGVTRGMTWVVTWVRRGFTAMKPTGPL
jgi:hypothetical protein